MGQDFPRGQQGLLGDKQEFSKKGEEEVQESLAEGESEAESLIEEEVIRYGCYAPHEAHSGELLTGADHLALP